jgi:hypothetical protein
MSALVAADGGEIIQLLDHLTGLVLEDDEYVLREVGDIGAPPLPV